MPYTSIKVTTDTRDRIKDLGGKYEDTLTEALDLLEAARFWEQAEAGKRWLDSLSDSELLDQWKFLLGDATSAVERVDGVQSVKWYSGAGALRANLTVVVEMDSAGVYERMIADPGLTKLLGRFYGAMDLKSSTQTFVRQVTPALIAALSGTD